MEVYCHLCFLKYCPSTFQQYYIDLDISIMVYSKEYLTIFDTGSIHRSKMSTNVTDNFLTHLQYNLDDLIMRLQPVKIIFAITSVLIVNNPRSRCITFIGIFENCNWPSLVRITAFSLRFT